MVRTIAEVAVPTTQAAVPQTTKEITTADLTLPVRVLPDLTTATLNKPVIMDLDQIHIAAKTNITSTITQIEINMINFIGKDL